jgi:DNA-binding response OmpR family regulator
MTDPSALRVLIVDDDPGIRRLLELLLRRQGWVVDSLGDGSDAVDRIVNSRPDVVVLDLMLPGTSGFEVLDRLLEQEPTLVRKVVVVTAASAQMLTGLHCQESIWKLLRKPFDITELVSSVSACAAAQAHAPAPVHAGALH